MNPNSSFDFLLFIIKKMELWEGIELGLNIFITFCEKFQSSLQNKYTFKKNTQGIEKPKF